MAQKMHGNDFIVKAANQSNQINQPIYFSARPRRPTNQTNPTNPSTPGLKAILTTTFRGITLSLCHLSVTHSPQSVSSSVCVVPIRRNQFIFYYQPINLSLQMKRLKLFLGLVAALFMAATNSVDAQTFTTSTAPDPSATTWASDTKWYKMKIDGGKYITLSQTGDYGSLKLSATSAEDTDMRALWCVTGNETDGYQFYNMAAGPSAVLGMTSTEKAARARMYSKFMLESIGEAPVTVFDRKTPADKTYEDFVYHGTANNTWNNRDGFLATWDSGAAIGDGCTGSQVTFEAVDLSGVTIDYATNYTNVLTAVKSQYSVGDTYRLENYATYIAYFDNTTFIPTTVSTEEQYYQAMYVIQMYNTTIFGTRHTSLNDKQITLASSDNKYPVADDASATVLATSELTKECVWTLKASGDGHYYLYNRPTRKYLNTTSGTDGETPVELNTTPRAYLLEYQSDGTIRLLDEAYGGNRYLRINNNKLVRGMADVATTFTMAEASEELQIKAIYATIKYDPQDGLDPYVVSNYELTEGDDVMANVPALDYYSLVSASPATVDPSVTEYNITCASIKSLLQVRPNTYYLYIN
ncbi:MAG: hypothetical protein ACI4V2_02155, partial [Alloprevotella sp.]